MDKPPTPDNDNDTDTDTEPHIKAVVRDENKGLRQRLRVQVRALRNKKGLTLKVASERAELHWRHWQKIEAAQSNATLATLVKLAQVLDVELPDLFGEPEQPESESRPP